MFIRAPPLRGDEAVPALLDVVARLLFSPLFRGDERLDVALLCFLRAPPNAPAGELLRGLFVARGARRLVVVLPASGIPGKYACFENAAYRELLNKHGQPCNANPAAKAAFLTRFRYRSWPSVSAHPNHFNLDEYKEWQGGDKGNLKWVGFQWRLLGD